MTLLTLVLDHAWSISPEAFRTAVEQEWPSAEVTRLDHPTGFALRWKPGDPDVWEGQLSSDGSGLTIDGTIEGGARVASWFRELVPAEHAMWFLDLGNNAHVDVPPGITASALAEAYIKAANS